MSDDKPANFNVASSISRIDGILTRADNTFVERDFIPPVGSLTFSNGNYVPCVALCTDIRGSSTLPELHTRPVLAKIYRTYLSEIPAVMTANKLCKHLHIVGDAVVGIFNVPIPGKQMDELFLLAAEIQSLIMIMNDKFEQKGYTPIRVGLGMDYGRALMVKAGLSGSGYNDVVWMGDVVNQASKLSNSANKEPDDHAFMITADAYNHLSSSWQGYLEWSVKRGCYHGTFHNKQFLRVYEAMKKRRLQPTVQQMQPTLSASATIPTASFFGITPKTQPASGLTDVGKWLSTSPSQPHSALSALALYELMKGDKK